MEPLTKERHEEQKWFHEHGYAAGYRAGVKALLDAFSDRIPKVQWLWMLQEEAERLLKECKR